MPGPCSKKLLAALLALLTAFAVLPLAAQPAAAHERTNTVRRCAYDPFAGNQCWTETVSVAHSHGKGSGGRKPPSCPPGTTGTYPNCYPTPPADSSGGGQSNGGSERDPSNQKNINNAKDRNQNGNDDQGGGSTDSDGDPGSGTQSGAKGTRSNRDSGKAPSAGAVCRYIDPVAFGGIPHEHDGLGCHDSTPGHQHTGGIGRDPGEPPGDGNGVLEGIKKLWDATPDTAKTYLVGFGCTGLVVLAAKSIAATGGVAAPAWVKWAAGTGAGIECARRISALLPSNSGGDDQPGSHSDDPPTLEELEDAVDEAERNWMSGQITRDELHRIQNERDCAKGYTDACEALGR